MRRRRERIFYEKVAKGNGMSRALRTYFFAFAGAAEGNSIKHPISSLRYVVYVHIFRGGGARVAFIAVHVAKFSSLEGGGKIPPS